MCSSDLDGQEADFASTATNQFRIRALGGLNLMDGDMYLGTLTPAFGSGGNAYFENSGGDSKNSFRVDGFFNNLYIAANSASGAGTGAGIVFRTATAGQGASESDTMVIKPDGKVGIGTNTPLAPLSLQGQDNWSWVAGNGWGDLNVGNGTVGLGIGVALAGGGAGDVRMWAKGGAQRIIFGNPTNGDTMAMAASSIGIRTLTPADALHVAGDVRVGTGTTGCVKDADATVIAGTCSSDLRFKKNVKPLAASLERIAALRPVTFDWRVEDFPEKHFGAARSFGLIAQEAEQTVPELVTTDEQGYKAVNYSQLPLLAIQAIRELKAENDALKAEMAELRALVESRLGTQVSRVAADAK